MINRLDEMIGSVRVITQSLGNYIADDYTKKCQKIPLPKESMNQLDLMAHDLRIITSMLEDMQASASRIQEQ